MKKYSTGVASSGTIFNKQSTAQKVNWRAHIHMEHLVISCLISFLRKERHLNKLINNKFVKIQYAALYAV
jgi:hypothetical protein